MTIELRSDTFTLPSPAMYAAIQAAALGDDVYGEDPTACRLEALAAQLLGKPAACFMPSGTMANLATLMVHCPRGTKVLVGDESDIWIYEAGGAAVCGGVVYEPIVTQSDGRLLIADLARAFPVDPDDAQFALPALICLENTHNRCGGRALPLGYLAEVAAFARERGVRVHMDGARIFNAALALGVSAAEVAGYVDSVQFCLSKGLAAPVGSMVVGECAFIAQVRRMRKMLGGGMRQVGIVAAAGIVALEEMVGRLAEDHVHARRLAEGLAQVPGIAVDPQEVQTNIVFFRVIDERFTWQTFLAAAAKLGVRVGELGHGRLRAVTHYGVRAADIDAAVAIVAQVLRNGP